MPHTQAISGSGKQKPSRQKGGHPTPAMHTRRGSSREVYLDASHHIVVAAFFDWGFSDTALRVCTTERVGTTHLRGLLLRGLHRAPMSHFKCICDLCWRSKFSSACTRFPGHTPPAHIAAPARDTPVAFGVLAERHNTNPPTHTQTCAGSRCQERTHSVQVMWCIASIPWDHFSLGMHTRAHAVQSEGHADVSLGTSTEVAAMFGVLDLAVPHALTGTANVRSKATLSSSYINRFFSTQEPWRAAIHSHIRRCMHMT